MKERPILFSGPMVRALLDGSKTQTRRPFSAKMIETMGFAAQAGEVSYFIDQGFMEPNDESYVVDFCPYGQHGDRLYVRETFFAYGHWVTRFSERKCRDEWHFIDMTLECDRAYQYEADNPDVPLARGRGALPGWYKRPAIFMPRTASRIPLDIACVRVERVKEIGQKDAIAEGIIPVPKIRPDDPHERQFWHDYRLSGDGTFCVRTPEESFASLWRSINGAESWDANPWVWAVEFKRVLP